MIPIKKKKKKLINPWSCMEITKQYVAMPTMKMTCDENMNLHFDKHSQWGGAHISLGMLMLNFSTSHKILYNLLRVVWAGSETSSCSLNVGSVKDLGLMAWVKDNSISCLSCLIVKAGHLLAFFFQEESWREFDCGMLWISLLFYHWYLSGAYWPMDL